MHKLVNFLEKYTGISKKLCEELSNSNISYSVDYERREINIDINPASPFSIDLWLALLNVVNPHLNISFSNLNPDFIFESLGIDKIPTITTTSLVFDSQVENIPLLRKVWNLVFKKDIEILFSQAQKKYLVFDKEIKKDHKGNSKCKVGITDGVNYYWLSLVKNSELFESLQIGTYYSVEFDLSTNAKFKEFIDGFLLNAYDPVIPEVVKDTSEKKLYNFCIHTKTSAFDGIYYAQEFAKRASEIDHEYLGVTDLYSVQSYAALQNQKDAKVVYGAEIELVPDDYPAISYQPTPLPKIFCVLDIETTGLNPLVDDLIQIHIEKLNDETTIDTYSSFVKTDKTLREHIVALTKITPQILESQGRDIVTVLKEVKEFVKGSVLVAHNGIAFDLPFINAKYREHGLEPLSEPLLDTMRLSQHLFATKKYKSHSLAAVAKKANLSYKEEEAHDAGYDVSVLVAALRDYLLPELRLQKLKLNFSFDSEEVYNYVHGFSANIYVKNQEGVRDLYELISISHTSYFFSNPKLKKNIISSLRKNLIITSSPLNSELIDLVLKNDEQRFIEAASFYDYIIIPPPNHFIHEVERHLLTQEEVDIVIKTLYAWCKKHNKKYLLNSAVRYLDPSDYERYLVLINAKGLAGKRHYLYSSKSNPTFPDFSFQRTNDLISKYEHLGIENLLEEAFENQSTFLKEIGQIKPVRTELLTPKIENSDQLLKTRSYSSLIRIYGEKIDEYLLKRYEFELKRIIENGFSVIYWVSSELVNKSESDGFLVGSRGSVGSSFVAFLMNISEVNPLPPHYSCNKCSYFDLQDSFLESGFDLPNKPCPHCGSELRKDGHNIPFETFLGFGGDKVPDIDLNFSGEYQATAHSYLKDYFGEFKVFRAGTISTCAEKTAYAISKEYFEEVNSIPTQGKIRWLVARLVDLKRTTGQHPGGILVVPNDYSIYDFTPINYPANDKTKWLTTHFQFEDLHDSLLKFDVLGHDDPTTLAELKKLTGVDPKDIKYDDKKILELYRSLKPMNINSDYLVNNDETGAIGLPEFGTLLTRKIIRDCQPKCFADLIRISGFSHGTGVWKQNIDSLVKNEKKPLNQVITCRDDIMIYLLSMNLDRKDAFNITEDIRKGKGVSKKNIDLMKEKNVPEWYIESAKKISYIFPKAHATAYVLMSWKIAYYKLYYPLAFYAVWFSLNYGCFDFETLMSNNPHIIKQKYLSIKDSKKANAKEKSYLSAYEVALEFLSRGFSFKKITINESKFNKFKPSDKGLLVPFIVVDGIGEVKAKLIEEEREKNGNYSSIEDLVERTGLNKKAAEIFPRILN